jgi:hypothetical protein
MQPLIFIQQAHDLEIARAKHGAEIERTVTPRTSAIGAFVLPFLINDHIL